MRVLKKTFQACGRTRREMREALLSCLRAYRTTPHPVTNVPPASLMFSNYRSEILSIPGASKAKRAAIRGQDRARRQKSASQYNSKPKVKPVSIFPGQDVILRNQNRTSKFQPKFLPTPHEVLNRVAHGIVLVRNKSNGVTCVRHEDDLKKIPETTQPGFSPASHLSQHTPMVPLWIDEPRRNLPSDQQPIVNDISLPSPPDLDTRGSEPPQPISTSVPTSSTSSPNTLEPYRPEPESQRKLDELARKFGRHSCQMGHPSHKPALRRSKRVSRPPERLGFGRFTSHGSCSSPPP